MDRNLSQQLTPHLPELLPRPLSVCHVLLHKLHRVCQHLEIHLAATTVGLLMPFIQLPQCKHRFCLDPPHLDLADGTICCRAILKKASVLLVVAVTHSCFADSNGSAAVALCQFMLEGVDGLQVVQGFQGQPGGLKVVA